MRTLVQDRQDCLLSLLHLCSAIWHLLSLAQRIHLPTCLSDGMPASTHPCCPSLLLMLGKPGWSIWRDPGENWAGGRGQGLLPTAQGCERLLFSHSGEGAALGQEGRSQAILSEKPKMCFHCWRTRTHSENNDNSNTCHSLSSHSS